MKEEWWKKVNSEDNAQKVISRRAEEIRKKNKYFTGELAHCFAIEQYITAMEEVDHLKETKRE